MMHVEVIVTENYEEMSDLAKERVLQKVKEKPAAVLGLATGSTVMRLYEGLVEAYRRGEVDFSQIKAFNLDEYVGLSPSHPCSYHYFMKEYFYNHVNVSAGCTYIPDGVADDLQAVCEQYEQTIQQVGGIDLQILGIGQNGHIGFNEPGSPPDGTTQVVRLTDNTIEVNSRFFDNKDEMPREAVTVGIGTIMKQSKEIILLANGENKARAIKNMIESKPHVDHPASFLQLHGNVTVIVDRQAAKLLKF